jgi:hypothetical protein
MVVLERAAQWPPASGAVRRDGSRRPAARLSLAPGAVAVGRASVPDPGSRLLFPVVRRADAPEVAANRLSSPSSRSLAEHRARAPSARSRAGPAAVPERAAQWSFASGAVRPDGLRGLARSSFDLAAAVARRRAACLPAVLPLLPDPGVVRAFRQYAGQRQASSCELPFALLRVQAAAPAPAARSWAAPADAPPILPSGSLKACSTRPAPLPARMLDLLLTPQPGRPLHWPQAWSRRPVAQRPQADGR